MSGRWTWMLRRSSVCSRLSYAETLGLFITAGGQTCMRISLLGKHLLPQSPWIYAIAGKLITTRWRNDRKVAH
jgi:hypothetical protein